MPAHWTYERVHITEPGAAAMLKFSTIAKPKTTASGLLVDVKDQAIILQVDGEEQETMLPPAKVQTARADALKRATCPWRKVAPTAFVTAGCSQRDKLISQAGLRPSRGRWRRENAVHPQATP